jgi:O-antigen/teichoic acid export membrane protein
MLLRADNFGIATAALTPLAMGICGILGILGAAIRLANRAASLAHEKLRRRMAKTGLFAGVFVSLFPLKAALSGSPWDLLAATPFCIGVMVLIGTISIGKGEGEFN